ncbi:MAG TPA: hypothetical protein VEQ34_04275 [Pyrinomonadaceae bacterium]|nr:hypothetical protein [Pyrinomonadaceae bacterium]
MRNNRAGFQKIAVLSRAATCLLLTTAREADAQRTLYPVDRRIEQIICQNQDFERDKMNREMKGDARKPENAKRTQAIKAQIKEDLEGIQAAYNEIVTHLQSGKELNRDFVTQEASKVKKYADRLKTNLMLPEPESEKTGEIKTEIKPEEKPETAKQSLLTLCQHIYKFVTNPIFDAPTGLRVDLAAKARDELEKIIRISEKIEKGAESAKK